MALKRILFVMTMLLFCASTYAQEGYVILATKGSSALFAKPAGKSFQKGDRFLAKRTVNGQDVEVAQVKIALLDSRYYGVKVETPLADNRLRKGDFLVSQQPESGGFSETLSFLDQFDSGRAAAENQTPTRDPVFSMPEETDPGTEQTNASFDLDNADSLNNLDDIFSIDSPPSPAGAGAFNQNSKNNARQFGPTVSPMNSSGSYLGLSVAAMAPISNTADRYAVGPGFGLQAVTNIGLRSNLRWSIQHTILNPSSAVQSSLNTAGFSQNSGLTLITVSVQPRIMNHFVLDLGVGYYRQFDEINTGVRTTTTTKNAIGTLTGLGYHLRLSRSSSLMLLGTGNFYFLEGDNAAFFSLLAGYFFTI